MKTLYIIGNGFDRYHGLDTRYQAFGLFLQENDSELYDNLIKYYGFRELDIDDDESFKDPTWADFESMLSNLDFESILDENTGYLPNYASDDFRDSDHHAYQQVMESIVEELTDGLVKAFNKFILNIEYPDSIERKMLKIDSNELFLNFNYTITLEKYYNVEPENILYIHNKAISQDSYLILGHGVNPEEFKTKDEVAPEGLSEEDYNEWYQQMADSHDYSFDSGRDELISYFEKSFKHTSDNIQHNLSFFEKMKGIDKVIVLGHSLSDIDLQYFFKIVDSIGVNNIEWVVTYFWPEEIVSHRNQLRRLGLKDEQITLIKIDELLK